MSIGRLGPSKDHFVVAWDATIVEDDTFFGVLFEPAEPEFETEPHRKQ